MNTFKGIFSVCLALVIVLSACNGQDTPATQAPKDPVTIQLQWITQTQFAGYYVALDKGWYAEEGIDLTIRAGGPDISPIDMVRNGAAQFGTNLLTDLIVANQNTSDLVSIAQIQQSNGLLLIAKKDSGITGPQDFAGRKVGVWLGNWEAQFNALIAKENVDPDSFTLVPQAFTMDPFINGELDVASAMIYNEYYSVIESGLKAEDLTVINYADYGLDFPGDTLFTSRKLLEENPDLCVRMLRATLRGWKYAVEHPEEASVIVLSYDQSGVQTAGHQLSMMNEIVKLVEVTLHPLGFTDRDDVRRVIDALYSYKVISAPIEPDSVFTNSIWEQAQP